MTSRILEKRTWGIVSLLIVLASAGIEAYSGTGVYAGCGYTLAVILTLYSESRANTIIVTVTACLAILFSVLYLHSNEDIYSITVNHTFSLTGTIVAMFFVVYVKDIRDKAEEHNKQVNSLFSHATEGVILTNSIGEIVLVNPYAEDLFGYFKDELVGQKIETLLPENLRSKHVLHRDAFHMHPVNRTMGAGGRDLYAKRKDGSVFPVEISISQYTMSGESYVIAFISDITIRKQHDEVLRKQSAELEAFANEVKELNSQLEQKVNDRTMMLRETLAQLEKSKDELAYALEKEKQLNDLKSRFVSTVSHEFRTPLSTILSSASLVAKYVEGTEQDKRERHVLRIKDSVRHMNGMLEDLLSLGRLEEGLVEVRPETFDLKKSMREFINEMNEIAKPGQQIAYTIKGDMNIRADRRLLKNVLINLVSNAVKFSPEDSRIEIACANENGKLTISVKDSGMGISEEDQQHLFERFFRARNAANIKGTGLGLHIVARYVELLGGHISMQSKLGEGSIFTIIIQSE